ncbi:MAG: Trp biosynthesis-associated membrane protein [Marmoricola sp.]|nr:Trp biosynthesis-associated membrane protein [Marmoricola sp.]
MADRDRSSFGPVVLLGLGSSALAAVASAKPWIGSGSGSGTGTSDAAQTALDSGTTYPAASAVSLVLLAVWGVLLVTRGVVRRVFAVLAVVAAAALLATVLAGHSTLHPDRAGSLAQSLGRTSGHLGWTGWFWTAAVTSVLALVAGVLAVRFVGDWPEMGRRYDAPTDAPATQAIESDRDLWKALDEGRDPTRDP